MRKTEVEPWMSGSLTGMAPPLAAVVYSLQQVGDDIERWTEGLTDEQMWLRPHGVAPLGFQLRHIAGSLDRLFAYSEGRGLDKAQVAELRSEQEPGMGREALLERVRMTIERISRAVLAIDPATLDQPRGVGRKLLPSTRIGLLFHMAEHAQRHVGEAIVTAKLLR